MTDDRAAGYRYVRSIRCSGLTIYDAIDYDDPELWIPTPELEQLLNEGMVGISLAGLPLRTRSKVVKEHVCRTLGYSVPTSFKRTQPRFLGQMFDLYVQKSNNLQIWNEDLEPTRRYVIVQVGEQDAISKIRVVTGAALALLDRTGTLTQKYQAKLTTGQEAVELVTGEDTEMLSPLVNASARPAASVSPVSFPRLWDLLPIGDILDRLRSLVGRSFPDAGHDQERNRGAELHRLVCGNLGYKDYRDDGQFPDVRHQLLEVKLQTSPTIDLGLVCPDSTEPLDVPRIGGLSIRHCDVRYAIFYATTDGEKVTLSHLVLTTGEKFFSRFTRFEGRVLNRKLQIPLPSDFFDE